MPQGDAPRAAAASRARYRRIVRFATGVMLATWWFEVVLPRIGFARVAERGRTARLRRISARFRVLAIDLGGLMIKVGQFLSSRLDVLPPEVTSELEQLQDEVPAVPFAEIEALAESELGVPLHRAYAWFDETPVAAASLGQAHRAQLSDDDERIAGFREVVVKVQRPTIGAMVREDLKVMATLAPLLVGRIPIAALANPPALVELFAETILEELDFRLEAENMLDVAEVFAQLGQRGWVIARPHPELVTRRVLVMERLSGFAFEDFESMQAAGIDTHEIIRIGMKGFTEGCIVHGLFHGDLHAGNLFVTPDGRIALLDFGITARMTPLERSAFLRLMLFGAMGDIPGQIAAFRDLGALPADTDIDEVIRELGLDKAPVDPTTLSQDQLVSEIQRIIKALMGMGARLPKILMLYVKNLVFLDGAIAVLAPDLDLVAEVAALSTGLATTHGDRFAAELGVSADGFAVDETAIRASFGIVDDSTEPVTYSELRKRRETIRKRLDRR